MFSRLVMPNSLAYGDIAPFEIQEFDQQSFVTLLYPHVQYFALQLNILTFTIDTIQFATGKFRCYHASPSPVITACFRII